MSERTTYSDLRVEDNWPAGLAPVHIRGVPWDMSPQAPFRLQRWMEAPPGWARGEWHVEHDLETAIARFLQWPVEEGMIAMLMDESFRCVLGWSADAQTWATWKNAIWYGVRESFAAMEQSGRYDPWEILDREVQAMVTAAS